MRADKKLKVLRLAPVLDFGGVESRFTLQCREWRDHRVHVEYACFWKDGAAASAIREAGGTVHVLREDPSVRNLGATRKLLTFLHSNEFDIVHSSIGDANFHAMLCAKLGPWKTIIEEAGIPQRRLRNRLIHAALYRLPDRIVCVSQASAENILKNEWAPPRKVQVIHNAIDAKHFRDLSTREPDQQLFRAVGRLTAVKNFDGLLRAFAIARQTRPDIRLEIVGEGEERPNLEALIQSLGLQEHASLLGYRDDVHELHRTTGWLLAPSHREGFGLMAAEAMAAGVPVIASTAGGLPEVLGGLRYDWTLYADNTSVWAQKIVNSAHYSSNEYRELSSIVQTAAERFHPTRYVSDLSRLYTTI